MDDAFQLYDLRVEVVATDRPMVCSHHAGDAFIVEGARALHRPAFLPVPAFAVKLLFGAMGREALLASARVHPARLLERGFTFRLPRLDAALNSALSGLNP